MIKTLALVLALSAPAIHGLAQSVTDTAGKKPVKLQDVTIKADGYDYQDDSVNRRSLYKKDYRILNDKTTVHVSQPAEQNPGIFFNGLFTDVANRVSGRKKNAERNIGQLQANKERHYVEARYTPQLVGKLTNLTGDTLANFMNQYPMSYGFASNAKELEFKAWIRDNFKAWRALGSPMYKQSGKNSDQ